MENWERMKEQKLDVNYCKSTFYSIYVIFYIKNLIDWIYY